MRAPRQEQRHVNPALFAAPQAEKAILGAMLCDDNIALELMTRMRPGDFGDDLHQRVFAGMCALIGEGKPLQRPILLGRIETKSEEDASLEPYLAALQLEAVDAGHALDYADVVREAAARRACLAGARSLERYASAVPAGASAEDIISGATDHVGARFRSLERGGKRRVHDARAAADIAMEHVRAARARGDGLAGAATGLRSLDRLTGGLPAGDVILLAGRPSMGKTTLATGICKGTAQRGNGVGYFSLEMGTAPISLRIICDMLYNSDTKVAYDNALKGRISDHEEERLAAYAERFAELPIIIDERPGLSLADIMIRARMMKRDLQAKGVDLKLLVVDHIGLVKPPRARESRNNEVQEISAGMKILAKDLDCCVLALCQLTRGPEQRDDKRPQLSDLRDSGALEQDADAVHFVFREAYYLSRKVERHDHEKESKRLTRLLECQNRMECIVAKQRNGPTATVELHADMASSAIRDLDREHSSADLLGM